MRSKPLNILLVISKMGKGGAQRIVLDLANGLAARGARVDLLVFFRTPQDTALLEALDPRVRLISLFNILLESDHRNRLHKIVSVIFLPVFTLWWVISGRLRRYDVVHSHLLLASIFSWFAAVFQKIRRWPRPKYVETFHGDLIAIRGWEQALYFFLWKTRDVLVTEIRRRDYQIIQGRLPQVQVRYIPFGIVPLAPASAGDVANFKSMYAIPEHAPIILSIARLNDREKRVSDLVAVIDRFRQLYRHDFIYILMGDGPDHRRIKSQIRSLGLDRVVRITGYSDHISAACTAAKAFFVAGVEDLVGIAGLQAASLGLPLVLYQVDPSWQDDSPIFFNSASLSELASELTRLLSDEEYHRRASARSTAAVQSIFSAERMISSYADLYRELTVDRCPEQ